MPWNSIWPVGITAVKGNKAEGQENTAYIKATMDVDHFFDDSDFGSLSGLHRYVRGPKLEDPDTGTPADPSLVGPPASDGALYWKEKVEAESTVQQDVQPFFMNQVGLSTNIMQILGIRAMGVFDSDTEGVTTILYSHGVETVADAGDDGTFLVTFSTPTLPSASYSVIGGAVINDNDDGSYGGLGVKSSTTNAFKTVSTVTIVVTKRTSTAIKKVWPKQAWFVVFGG